MPASKLMLIRHAEKGDEAAGLRAVNAQGVQDSGGLSVRGWQRAGALVRWLAPLDGHFADERIARPTAIFAAAVSAAHPSARPRATVQPLADALHLHIDDSHAADAPAQRLLLALASLHGPVLLCWRHRELPALLAALTGNAPLPAVPAAWPEDRCDLLWLLDDVHGRWHFDSVPQRLLPGDGDSGA